MKKVFCVFMAILMLGCSIGVVGFAADEETTVATVTKEEHTTRNIKNDDGLVVPINFTQLKQSFIFKLIEKFITFILHLFNGDNADSVDQTAATAVSEIISVLDERLSDVDSSLEAATN